MCLSAQSVRLLVPGAALAIFLFVSVGAEAVEQIKFLKATVLPKIGLRLRIMPDADEAPLPPPTVYTYTRTDDVSTSRLEMFAPYDLWRRTQQAAAWTDGHSNSLVIAVMTHPLPQGFQREHVKPDEYEARLTGAAKPPDDWGLADLTRWVADFTRSKTVTAEPVARCPPSLSALVAFPGAGADGQRAAYAFRLNSRMGGQASATQSWFFALIEPARGVPPDKARQALLQQFLPYLAAAPSQKQRPGGPAARFESLNRGGVAADSPEFAASRQLVTSSIANLKEWWCVETRNYIILSNLSTQNRRMIKDLQTNIEVLRSALERLIPPRAPVRAVSVIRVFASAAEYKAYVGADLAWTYGVWMPAKKELVIRPLETADIREAGEHIERAIYHEAFHQYLFYAMDQLDASAWFNEGYATVFENAEIRNGRISIGEDAYRVGRLQKDLAAGGVNVERMLHLTLKQFYVGDESMRGGNYALAWGLVYYLLRAPVPEKPAAFQSILETYSDTLWETKDPAQATGAAFAGINLSAFTKEFTRFWNSEQKRNAARRNKLTP